jgi:hypothetical protein
VVLQFVAITFNSTIGSNPVLIKLGVVAGLCESAFFLARSVQASGGFAESFKESHEPGKRVVTWIGAILTLLEFINIMFGLWEKLFQ